MLGCTDGDDAVPRDPTVPLGVAHSWMHSQPAPAVAHGQVTSLQHCRALAGDAGRQPRQFFGDQLAPFRTRIRALSDVQSRTARRRS